ncbi:MAG: anthranilate phosphoribosyltransferase [Candidatus Omnitrophica bacterium]|nr:anthranilate phosphoribosyltransferase [Candidatus Omnitrophota bacterium]
MIKEAIARAIEKKDLTRREMEGVMEEILTGKATSGQIACFLTALRAKTETVEEITGAVIVMRKHVTKIRIKKDTVLDTCGTGGDRKGTFNISTAAAFVAAGLGIVVAKHGNRSISSLCGSADLLEQLGVDINMDEVRAKNCLEEIGIAFLFAPNFHPAMKFAMPVRQEIGIRTLFNLLGPLTNPADATHQLVGVYAPVWTEVVARVLKNIGTKHALVVHGEDGLDEITTTGRTKVSELKGASITTYTIKPENFGIKRTKIRNLYGATAGYNSKILKDILEGKRGPQRDIVLLNAGAAIYAADRARSIKEGVKLAAESIDSGAALKKLELLRKYSRKNEGRA